MFKSATFKLTSYYLAIIAVIVLGFSAVIYQVASNDLAVGLRRQTQRITEDFPVFLGSPYLHPGTELQEGREHLLTRLALCDALVLVVAGFVSYAFARQTLRPIEAAHERQKRFTADVSHELRTPLTALKMESEVALLDTATTTKELKETLASNVEEVEKLTLLIDNLLRLSQLDNAAIDHDVLQLNEVVKDAIKQVSSVAERRHIMIQTTLGKDATVTGERSTLTQLFAILLDNAIKYSPDNSEIEITVSTNQKEATVSIKDHGRGISKADLEHVFERFYRADDARTSGQETSGFGIGLSLAKLIADKHHAVISLTSRLGKGTTAHVTIPVVADQLSAGQKLPK